MKRTEWRKDWRRWERRDHRRVRDDYNRRLWEWNWRRRRLQFTAEEDDDYNILQHFILVWDEIETEDEMRLSLTNGDEAWWRWLQQKTMRMELEEKIITAEEDDDYILQHFIPNLRVEIFLPNSICQPNPNVQSGRVGQFGAHPYSCQFFLYLHFAAKNLTTELLYNWCKISKHHIRFI